nr:uncharacterized protein At3g49720-like [Ipomoea trifida]
MSRRPNTSRRLMDPANIPFVGSLHPKSRPSSFLSIGLVVVGALLIVGYLYHGSGGRSRLEDFNRLQDQSRELVKIHWPPFHFYLLCGGVSCTLELLRAYPILKKAYGESINKILHVGPDTCSVVSKLLNEEDTEAWGIEPYDLEDADANCKSLVGKGIVRAADIKFRLPYRAKSFSLVIVSDAVDYLSPKYINKTIPELARVAADGLVIFSGIPGQRRAKIAEMSKFGRPANLEENEAASNKFDEAAAKQSYMPACQFFVVLHLGVSPPISCSIIAAGNIHAEIQILGRKHPWPPSVFSYHSLPPSMIVLVMVSPFTDLGLEAAVSDWAGSFRLRVVRQGTAGEARDGG